MTSFNHSQFNSPKRKRGLPAISTIPPTPPRSSPTPDEILLNTDIPGVAILAEREEGAGSPRTKVAHNFQGLRLEDAGTMGRFELGLPSREKVARLGGDGAYDEGPNAEEEEAVRKRVKVLKRKRKEVPETPQPGRSQDVEKKFQIAIGPERTIDPAIGEAARGVMLSNEIDPVIFRGSPAPTGALGRAYPSINRLADSQSRKKRAGTPPLTGFQENGEMDEVLDPDRAAMTWHDDEITGHDPTDPDDDGEGINGIGFKPTAAEAYVRTQKRRQQMAEYKNREAREARKMRSERRRGSEKSKATKEEEETARRVRFMEVGAQSVVSTS